jgi:DNA-binding transcriptional LysR family regulator
LAISIDSENGTHVYSPSNTNFVVNPYDFGMPMDLRRLRYFVAVAEERSVGKAAERLRMAQPPLSVQIRRLEAEIGTPLFRRGTRGMDLTEAGQALLSRASEALALAADGAEAARAVAAGRHGRITVGYMFVLANAVLPRLIPELRRSIPGVDLEFAELSASTRRARLLDRSVTVALCMPAIDHPEIQVARIGTQRFVLAVPAGSTLARMNAVPMSKLQGRPLIALPKPDEEPASSAVAALLRRHQVVMPVAGRVETVHSALSLVLAGEGLAIVPACAKLGAPKGIVFRPLRDATDSIEIAVCWRRDSQSPLIRNFVNCAEKAVARL